MSDLRTVRAFAHHLPQSREGLVEFHRELVRNAGRRHPSGAAELASGPVRELRELIERDAVIRMLVEEMLAQAIALGEPPEDAQIKTAGQLLAALDYITTLAPAYNPDKKKRNAFPMSSLFGWMMMTVAGEELFRSRAFNDAIAKILAQWSHYLDSPASTSVLTEDWNGWLSPAAFKEFDLAQFVFDRAKPHWGWTSYNAFFHREIQLDYRPVSEPNAPKIIVSANDGNLVTFARNVQRVDRFWIKGEPFSLVDMLDHTEYVDRFVGGDVVQIFLSGGNYHRWHAPVDGTVLDARVVNGLLFSDAESAGWDPNGVMSEGYYASVNTRGLVFIQSAVPAIGTVCVIPIGITEISSVTIGVKKGRKLAKGDELGYFSYGGSSLCLVFQPGAIDEFLLPKPPDPMVDPSAGPPVLVNAAIAVAR